jgi:hypothetical protein
MAMCLWSKEYLKFDGDSMDFWDSLRADQRETCRDLVAQIKLTPSEASLCPQESGQ